MKQYIVKSHMIGASQGLVKGTIIDEKTLQDRGCDIDHLLGHQAIEEYKTEEEKATEAKAATEQPALAEKEPSSEQPAAEEKTEGAGAPAAEAAQPTEKDTKTK